MRMNAKFLLCLLLILSLSLSMLPVVGFAYGQDEELSPVASEEAEESDEIVVSDEPKSTEEPTPADQEEEGPPPSETSEDPEEPVMPDEPEPAEEPTPDADEKEEPPASETSEDPEEPVMPDEPEPTEEPTPEENEDPTATAIPVKLYEMGTGGVLRIRHKETEYKVCQSEDGIYTLENVSEGTAETSEDISEGWTLLYVAPGDEVELTAEAGEGYILGDFLSTMGEEVQIAEADLIRWTIEPCEHLAVRLTFRRLGGPLKAQSNDWTQYLYWNPNSSPAATLWGHPTYGTYVTNLWTNITYKVKNGATNYGAGICADPGYRYPNNYCDLIDASSVTYNTWQDSDGLTSSVYDARATFYVMGYTGTEALIRKMAYYGWIGARNNVGVTNYAKTYQPSGDSDGGALTHEAISAAIHGHISGYSALSNNSAGYTAARWTQINSLMGSNITKFVNAVKDLPDPPESFKVVYAKTEGNAVDGTAQQSFLVGFVDSVYGNLTIQKNGAPDVSVSGWEFTVTGPKGYTYKGKTNSSGKIELKNIPIGSYTITETEYRDYNQYTGTAASHTLGRTATVTVSTGKTATVNFYNEKKVTKFPFTIQKTSANTDFTNGNSCYSLEGAVYGLYKNAACTTLLERLTTDSNGNATTATKYEPGTYYIKEITPSPGYLLDSRVHTLTLAKNGTATVDIPFTEEPTNDPGRVRIKKSSNEASFPITSSSAVFKVEFYPNDSWSGSPTRTWYYKTIDGLCNIRDEAYLDDSKTNSNRWYTNVGTVTLPLGTVRVSEVEAPAGYLRTNTVLEARVTQDSPGAYGTWHWVTTTSSVIHYEADGLSLDNAPAPGQIDVLKRRADGSPLSGCTFLLEFSTDDGETWAAVFAPEKEGDVYAGTCSSEGLENGELITGADGHARFIGLLADGSTQYRITEVKAPDGYALLAEPVVVGALEIPTDAEGTTVELTVTDTYTYTLPHTGGAGFWFVALAVLLLAPAALLPILNNGKKGQLG